MNIEIRPPMPGKELLHRFETKAITVEEFDRETAYMLLESLDSMRRHIDPPTPTDILEYQRAKRARPNYQVSPEFWNQEEIVHWRNATNHNACLNNGNLHWLRFMLKHIPSGDVPNLAKVRVVIRTYGCLS
jgi:hypothetical protein